MNKELTEIIFILDESGSMGSVRNDVVGGFNTFVKDQKELPREAILTLVKFDTDYTKLHEGALLENVNDLNNETYRPGGMTALLDAVGKTINEVVSRHATLDKDEVPAKTIMVVFTDGEENSSQEFRKLADIAKMVKEREINKTYWAIVKNKPEKESAHLINFLKKNQKKNKSFICSEKTEGALKAELKYNLISKSDKFYLLEINLLTGRHHQIRAQLAHIGSPIKGDIKYGYHTTNKDASINLHARKIEFIHPVKKEKMEVIAPVPDDVLWKYFK